MTSQPIKRDPVSRTLATPEYAVLGVITLGPAHGYDVFRFLKENLHDVCRVGRSQTYAVLARLEQESLVSHERVDQASHPAKKIASRTPRGKDVFDAWLDSPVSRIRDLRVEFLVKLFFAELKGPEIRDRLVLRQLEVCRGKLARLEETRRSGRSRIESCAVDFRVAIVAATIGWLTAMLERG